MVRMEKQLELISLLSETKKASFSLVVYIRSTLPNWAALNIPGI